MSHVRFRLTREGWHFLFVLSFIFVGAVIREINLLILLAGTMIGLMLLQWRFSTRMLHGLRLQRDLPRHVHADSPLEVTIELRNSKRWLGSWMILVEDQLQRLKPNPRKVSDKGVALVQVVPPSGTATACYELRFLERGIYRIGTTTITSRFPIGLGRSWRSFDNAESLIVHPKLGQLQPAIRALLHGEREGAAKSASRSSVHEGEFFGLRDWQSGDSRRWIHWRTTAKRGELSVRQFEQMQRRQLSVAVDLYQPKTKPSDAARLAVEKAIAFAATLAAEFVSRDRDKLAFAIAGETVHVAPNVQSAVLVNDLLDRLAETKPSETPDLAAAVAQLGISLTRYPVLLVISTRDNIFETVRENLADVLSERIFDRLQIHWIRVSKGELDRYFHWEAPTN